MGKDKLKRFAQMKTFDNVIQPEMDDIKSGSHALKGRWREHFDNDYPITLELGCGKGEYTVAMARHQPKQNFIGIDIKGARMWKGAKQAQEEELANVRFLRTRIEFIDRFFAQGEVAEIWITFPDPFLKERKASRRLTAPAFLSKYARMLGEKGVVHLKTDSMPLHEYTLEVIAGHQHQLACASKDIDAEDPGYFGEHYNYLCSVRTHYETIFRNQGIPITYLRFVPVAAAKGKVAETIEEATKTNPL